MKAIIAVGLMAIGLAGCQTVEAVTGFAVTQGQVDTARSTYDGFLATMVSYRNLGYCATGTTATLAKPCADRGVVAQLRQDNAAIVAEFNTLQADIDSGDNTGALAAYQTVSGLISTAKSVLATAQGAN